MMWLYWTYLISLVAGLTIIILILSKELLYWVQQKRGILGFSRNIVPSWKERYKLLMTNNSEQQVVLTDIHCSYIHQHNNEPEEIPIQLGMTSLPILEKKDGTYTLVLMHLNNQGKSHIPRNLADIPEKSILKVKAAGIKDETKEDFSLSVKYKKTNTKFTKPLFQLGKLRRK